MTEEELIEMISKNGLDLTKQYPGWCFTHIEYVGLDQEADDVAWINNTKEWA